MDTSIGNQQVTSKLVLLQHIAWLAGIWDGEGTFQISKNGKNFLIARLTLTNTSTAMIAEVVRILDAYDIRGHLWLEEARSQKHKPCYHLTINRTDQVRRGAELMLPYLVNKKPHAELIIRFCESRQQAPKPEVVRNTQTGRIEGVNGKGYSDMEISFYEQLRHLNRTGQLEDTSETTR